MKPQSNGILDEISPGAKTMVGLLLAAAFIWHAVMMTHVLHGATRVADPQHGYIYGVWVGRMFQQRTVYVQYDAFILHYIVLGVDFVLMTGAVVVAYFSRKAEMRRR